METDTGETESLGMSLKKPNLKHTIMLCICMASIKECIIIIMIIAVMLCIAAFGSYWDL